MELLAAHKAREQQFNALHNELFSVYSTAYQAQVFITTEYKQQANYWKSQFDRSKHHESKLSEEIEELKAKLRQREQQLFGRRSEKGKHKKDEAPPGEGEKKDLDIDLFTYIHTYIFVFL